MRRLAQNISYDVFYPPHAAAAAVTASRQTHTRTTHWECARECVCAPVSAPFSAKPNLISSVRISYDVKQRKKVESLFFWFNSLACRLAIAPVDRKNTSDSESANAIAHICETVVRLSSVVRCSAKLLWMTMSLLVHGLWDPAYRQLNFKSIYSRRYYTTCADIAYTRERALDEFFLFVLFHFQVGRQVRGGLKCSTNFNSMATPRRAKHGWKPHRIFFIYETLMAVCSIF